MGKKNARTYRIVAVDEGKKRDGKVIETLGFYNPLTIPVQVQFNTDRINYWVSHGAQTTDAVKKLLTR